jgi:hypothetical protein
VRRLREARFLPKRESAVNQVTTLDSWDRAFLQCENKLPLSELLSWYLHHESCKPAPILSLQRYISECLTAQCLIWQFQNDESLF